MKKTEFPYLTEEHFIYINTAAVSLYSDLLRVGRSGDRILVVARFSAPAQSGPRAHPASYKMGTAYFPGVKRLGVCVDFPTPSNSEVKERINLYLYSKSGPSWPVTG